MMAEPLPVLDVALPLDKLVDLAEEYLGTDPTIFQKSGELVIVIKDRDGSVSIRPVKLSVLRYLLSRVASWEKDGKEIHPPSYVASCLIDRPGWKHIRHLRAVTTFPPLSISGEVCTDEGYDSSTGVYFTGQTGFCQIPYQCSPLDAKEAAATLLDIVCDFPFASAAHKSAWLAALLSPLARFTHEGNTPFVVIQANSPRVGKTNLVKIISHILSGNECPVITHTRNEDEERKRILSYLRAARSMVLIDNVVGQYGGAAANALATSRFFEDRVLGHSSVLKIVNDTTWFITGNNISLAPDTAERCLHVRLNCDSEKPHLRSGFSHQDLFGMIREKRGEYLSSALIILKAYIDAGMPDQDITPWGSFEVWSRIVRSALVWIGLPDPATTVRELEQEADTDRFTATMLVSGWLELQNEINAPDGLTAREAYNALSKGAVIPHLRDALSDIGGTDKLPPPHTIGRHLREIRDRNFGGLMLRCIPNEKTGHRWYVMKVESRPEDDDENNRSGEHKIPTSSSGCGTGS